MNKSYFSITLGPFDSWAVLALMAIVSNHFGFEAGVMAAAFIIALVGLVFAVVSAYLFYGMAQISASDSFKARFIDTSAGDDPVAAVLKVTAWLVCALAGSIAIFSFMDYTYMNIALAINIAVMIVLTFQISHLSAIIQKERQNEDQ